MKNVLIRAAQIAAIAFPLALPDLASASPVGAFPLPKGAPAAAAALIPAANPLQQILRDARQPTAATAGNFVFPYALATDTSGNLYVANLFGADVKRVNTALAVQNGVIATAKYPFSMAVDNVGNIYVGNEESNIQKFSASGALVGTITANANVPSSLAVDQYQDLFIANATGVAIDDVSGASIVTHVLTDSSKAVDAIAIGGATVYAFSANIVSYANGSYALRHGAFAGGFGPFSEVAIVGSACSTTGVCWLDDYNAQVLTIITFSTGGEASIQLPYQPAGIAYDATRNRLFVADPNHNSVHVYTASTLTYVTTIK